MLNLERLRVLCAVRTAGSVVGAAAALHVTTSAVSQQVARLEREVGQQLVERRGRGIRLTEAGLVLARGAGDLLAQVERVEAELAGHRGAVAGPVTVAAFATAARGLMPGALRCLEADHPDLHVGLVEMEPLDAVPALRRGAVDVAVVQDWADEPLAVPGEELSRLDLLVDPFDVAVPVGHRLAGAAVALAELAGEDWISWSTGQLCADWLLRAVPGARVVHSASEHATQLALVAAGLGVALLPRLGRGAVGPEVAFVELDPAPARRVFALWRTSAAARPALAAVVKSINSSV
jgi:DNA-binding transcriptional LysR family regulator